MAKIREKKPQTGARSCEVCRARKVRCDAQKPACGSCCRHKRECVYVVSARRARPTLATINQLREENERLQSLIRELTKSSGSEGRGLSHETPLTAPSAGRHDETRVASSRSSTPSPNTQLIEQSRHQKEEEDHQPEEEPAPDVSPYLWMDEDGNLNSFGPSSVLQSVVKPQDEPDPVALVHVQNGLLANALLSRQQEHHLMDRPDVHGVPIDLAMHLLELHWNRQHHTFLITYRPAIMRDLLCDGPFASKFLINAIFACACKFSRRPDVLDRPDDPTTAGGRFFRRCEELIQEERLMLTPSIPTIIGLLLLGSTYNAKGLTSKAWMLTGSALRMVFDLGLHIDHKITQENAEEVEIARRVFWGAFISDKLQSLYLGRPSGIRLHDAHVSYELNDIMEENELWTPYPDGSIFDDPSGANNPVAHGPIHSVSCFRQLCLLIRIVSRIIDNFYVVGATPAGARAALKGIDSSLIKWEAELPVQLRLDPATGMLENGRRAAPNVLALHLIYHAVIVLLHRPLVAEGHLTLGASAPATSWKRCTIAARNITNLAVAYRTGFTFRAAPYLISYSLYVACTVHVRNTAVAGGCQANHSKRLAWSLRCLEELAIPNPGVTQPIVVIKKLMLAKGLDVPAESSAIDFPELPADNSNCTVGNSSGMQELGLHVPPSDLFTGEIDFDWNDWNESFQDDVLYGFMSGQQYPFGEMMPEVTNATLGGNRV